MVETTRSGLEDLGRFTDLYLLTRAQSYFEHRKNRLATFSLFIRKYPLNRTFFVAAGLATGLDDLQQVQFPSSAPAHLRRRLIDVSLRRTHGTDAAMNMARVSYLSGFDSTSTVLVGQRYGLPMAGTMAHSYVPCFPDEIEALRAFANPFLQQAVLLTETYDIMAGARRAAKVSQEMARWGQRLLGVRLDSGDMTTLNKEVWLILDAAGLPEVQIGASRGFDAYAIAQAVRNGACIDVFGVATKMGMAAESPYSDRAYHAEQMARLPTSYKRLDQGEWSPVGLSTALARTQQEIEAAIRGERQVGSIM